MIKYRRPFSQIEVVAAIGAIMSLPCFSVTSATASVMAEPYASGAPEVEALLRLREAGLRVQEVAVHMRAREHGESKLQGSKAVKLVLTVVGTLVFFGWWRRRRS